MNYDMAKAIEEVIDNCREFGSSRVQRKDDNGNIILWLEAEWVEHSDGIHDVIEIYFYNDAGRIAYSGYIGETMIKR